jgi:NAD(P)-dependent dehydrogenase (short-subunit alcohol dehydrogenase family)
MELIKGKTAIVTGSEKGIDLVLAREGVNVVINSVNGTTWRSHDCRCYFGPDRTQSTLDRTQRRIDAEAEIQNHSLKPATYTPVRSRVCK